MPTFFPPTVSDRPHVSRDPREIRRNPLGHRLFRHYGTYPRGKNVYSLTSGTITETQPTDASLIRKIWYGGHYEPITTAEETALIAAGYAASITP